MKLRRSSEAQRNLANILEYIAVEQQNPIAAWDVLERIERTFEVLLDQPQIGRRSERPNTRKLTIAGLPFCVIYRIAGDTIEVLTIFHESQDPEKKLD
jgi:plasmid stabilization system protein ParE